MRSALPLLIFFVCNALIIVTDTEYTYKHVKSSFGPDYGNDTISGTIIKAEPFNACTQIDQDLTDKIVLATRDKSIKNCSFMKKLQNANATAVIVMNQRNLRWEGDELIQMGSHSNPTYNITIPSIFITYADGSTIQNFLSTSIVTAKINSEGETSLTFSIWQLISAFLILSLLIYISFALVGLIIGLIDFLQQRHRTSSYTKLINKVYSPKTDHNDAENPLECTVCLSLIEKGENITILPCNHIFHKECIDPWLKERKAVCPLCRRGIFDDDEINWVIEGKYYDSERLVTKWEHLYSMSLKYLFTIFFFTCVFLSPIITSLLLLYVC